MARRSRSIMLLCGLIALGLAVLPLWLVLAAGTAPPRGAAAAVAPAPASPANSVTVNAGADINVAPDMATVTFGVVVVRDSAQAAQADANAVITAAVRNLHALRIPDQRIQTAGISLQPNYDNSGN